MNGTPQQKSLSPSIGRGKLEPLLLLLRGGCRGLALHGLVHWGKFFDSFFDRPEPVVAEAESESLLRNPFALQHLARGNVKKDHINTACFLQLDQPIHYEYQADAF